MLQEVTLDGILLKDLLADVASNLAAVPKFQQVGSKTQLKNDTTILSFLTILTLTISSKQSFEYFMS